MTELCTICRTDVSGFQVAILECKHIFHAECLINYFRAPREWTYSINGYGTCPNCRQGPLGQRTSSANTTRGRISLIRRLSRTKNLHPVIQKTIIRLREVEKQKRDHLKEYKEFKRTNKEIIEKGRYLRRKKWRLSRIVRKCEQELASFDPLALINIYNSKG